jgi:hypothetical protein
MRRGEVYLEAFPFGDTAEVKPRSALLLTNTAGTRSEIVPAYVSSVMLRTCLRPKSSARRPGLSFRGLATRRVYISELTVERKGWYGNQQKWLAGFG